MKKIALIISGMLCSFLCMAQTVSVDIEEPEAPEGYKYVDTVIYRAVPRVNEELAGKTIYEVLPKGDVTVTQNSAIRRAVQNQVDKNRKSTVEGYRIRIYFDNKQDARAASEAAEKRFKALYPGYETYRVFTNPFFKVTVGDFRTKTDALIAIQDIKRNFPSAFIVKEQMQFPVISDSCRYVKETLRILVPIEPKAE